MKWIGRISQDIPPDRTAPAERCCLDGEYFLCLSREMRNRGERFQRADKDLETYVRRLLAVHRSPELNIIWRGAEPTSLGLDFVTRTVERFEELRQAGQRVLHTMHTNGEPLNDAWCAFFKKHRVVIGLGVDGPRAMHNVYRANRQGAGSFDDAVTSWDLLRLHRVNFTIVCTINAANANHPIELYRFFRGQLKDESIQFVPHLERNPAAAPGTSASEWPVDEDQFSRFLIAIFEEWVRRDVGVVFVRNFDDALCRWLGQPAARAYSPTRPGTIVAQLHFPATTPRHSHRHEGIPEPTIEELLEWSHLHGFAGTQSYEPPAENEPAVNKIRAGYSAFYDHIRPAMNIMTALLNQRRAASEVMRAYSALEVPRIVGGKVYVASDNACPCRSGKKFKHCHGDLETRSGTIDFPPSLWEDNLPRWLAKCFETVSLRIQSPAWRP